ncbi:MAG: PadR family transcriptional regulator [Candidatus Methanomethylophilaceae archaeon]
MESEQYWRSLINSGLTRLLILRAVSRGPTHGYAILQYLSEFTEGCCVPTYGSIYPILSEMENTGLAISESRTVNGRDRKEYVLTEKGRQAYQTAMSVWKDVMPYLEKVLEDHVE